jgi:hypothetical protein
MQTDIKGHLSGKKILSNEAKKRYFVISGEKDTESIIIIWHTESKIIRQIRIN